MDATEFAEGLAELVESVRGIDPAFADVLTREETAPEGVRTLVAEWSDGFARRNVLWRYMRFQNPAFRAIEDDVDALGVGIGAAFAAYAEGLTDPATTPEAHQVALEAIRDARRAEGLAAIVSRTEARAARAGLRMRHASFTRALDRAVPSPGFTVDYRAPEREREPGEVAGAGAGALIGTAMLPGVGTVIGGAAGWLGATFLHGKTPPINLEAQKAHIVQAGTQVGQAVSDACSDAADTLDANVADGPNPNDAGLWPLYMAVHRFVPEDAG